MDDFDRATMIEEQLRDAGLLTMKRARESVGASSSVCQEPDCGDIIPEPRREAAPGCRFCIECQKRREAVAKRRR